MGQAKQRQDNARDAVEIIDNLIRLRIETSQTVDYQALKSLDYQIEILKRALTDYLLVTDPRKGIYVRGEHG